MITTNLKKSFYCSVIRVTEYLNKINLVCLKKYFFYFTEMNYTFMVTRNYQETPELRIFYHSDEPTNVYNIEEEHMALRKALLENEALKVNIETYKSLLTNANLENFELKRQTKGLTLYVENLKKLVPKKEKEEPLPLNLTDIFDDTIFLIVQDFSTSIPTLSAKIFITSA